VVEMGQFGYKAARHHVIHTGIQSTVQHLLILCPKEFFEVKNKKKEKNEVISLLEKLSRPTEKYEIKIKMNKRRLTPLLFSCL
jgi:hypothetical protein